jgi:hypothetical protein
MRRTGKTEGHEAKLGKSIASSSVAGSKIGTKDTKMADVEFVRPDNVKFKAKQDSNTITNT